MLHLRALRAAVIGRQIPRAPVSLFPLVGRRSNKLSDINGKVVVILYYVFAIIFQAIPMVVVLVNYVLDIYYVRPVPAMPLLVFGLDVIRISWIHSTIGLHKRVHWVARE